jgi:uncharacterized protein YbbC (DUF1343 family)
MKKIACFLACCVLFCAMAYARSPRPAAEHPDAYLPLLTGKRIGITANHTSVVGEKHLVDVLREKGMNVVRIYAPEHGFRGMADAGERIHAEVDHETGIEVVSLYGPNYKPTPQQLKDIDYMLFDIQDVGVRFYTYLSTLHYVMEACAEHGIPLMVLDRPNPNGFYVDGPVLEMEFRSFVGMHPIPVVHGMTLGELAIMINDEGWLENGVRCNLTVIPCSNYTHKTHYDLLIDPSPNLPTMQAVYLYPSLCLFEGTVVSVGRGTEMPFEVFGHPAFEEHYSFNFTPQSVSGAQHPTHKDKTCYGMNLRYFEDDYLLEDPQLRLHWLIDAYNRYSQKEDFFTDFFYKLCGTKSIRHQLEQGMVADEIRASWKPGLEQFKELRKKYLLYEDFE